MKVFVVSSATRSAAVALVRRELGLSSEERPWKQGRPGAVQLINHSEEGDNIARIELDTSDVIEWSFARDVARLHAIYE